MKLGAALKVFVEVQLGNQLDRTGRLLIPSLAEKFTKMIGVFSKEGV